MKKNSSQIIPIAYVVVFFTAVAVLFIVSIYKLLSLSPKIQSKASGFQTLQVSGVANISTVDHKDNIIVTDLYIEPTKRNMPLYSARTEGLPAVYEFMQKNPQLNTQLFADNASPEQVSALPENFQSNSVLFKTIDEQLQPHALKGTAKHYFFHQKIKNVPVLGSFVRFDVEKQDVVGLQTKILSNADVPAATLSETQAHEIALKKAKSDFKSDALRVCPQTTPQKQIVNRSFLGLSETDENCIAYHVSFCENAESPTFNTSYFVCMTNGQIVLEESNIDTALSRTIFDCGSGRCRTARQEGGAATGDSDVDRSYDILGNIYNYFKTNFGRDSFDGRGAPMKASVKMPQIGQYPCPNAGWSGYDMAACPGMVAADVWGHEVTHGVVQYTAGLRRGYQSGALNEGFADVFGYAVDPDNWTMGEDTRIGVIRDFKNPGGKSTRIGPMPDRMFSPNFYCGDSADQGGVHHNSTVLTKALYLMIAGGSFNGCENIQPQPKEKILPVYYKALSTYLPSSANYKNAYEALIKACGDIYGLSSNECVTVKKSLLAVEMDQQGSGQKGPACPGSGKTRTAPNCAAVSGGGPTATTQPQPSPTNMVEPTQFTKPTPTRGQNPTPTTVSAPTPTEEPESPTPTDIENPEPTEEPESPTPTDIEDPEPTEDPGDPTPTDAQDPEPTTQPEEGEQISLTIAFAVQGITTFSNQSQMRVRVGLQDIETNITEFQYASFTNSDGIWVSDTIPFDDAKAGTYCVLIKGPYHIQKRICDIDPSETYPGSYKAMPNAGIDISEGESVFDFSNITTLVGDIADQDGVVNSHDISVCKAHIGRTDAEAIQYADVDMDQAVTTQDCALIYSALAFKFDEE